MQTGKIKFFNHEKGFGFITPDEGKKDVFVHVSKVEAGRQLNDGDVVEFETEEGKKGPQATKVFLLN